MKKYILVLLFVLSACSQISESETLNYSSIDLNDNGIIELGESLFIDKHALTFLSSSVIDASDNDFVESKFLVNLELHIKNYGGDNTSFWSTPDLNKKYQRNKFIVIKDPDGNKVDINYLTPFYFLSQHLNTASSYTNLQFSYTKDGDYTLIFDSQYEVEISVKKDEVINPEEVVQEFIIEPFKYNYDNVNVSFGKKKRINEYDKIYLTFEEYNVTDLIEIKVTIENKHDFDVNFTGMKINGFGSNGVEVPIYIGEYNPDKSKLSSSVKVPENDTITTYIHMKYSDDGEYTIMEYDGFPGYIKLNIPVRKKE